MNKTKTITIALKSNILSSETLGLSLEWLVRKGKNLWDENNDMLIDDETCTVLPRIDDNTLRLLYLITKGIFSAEDESGTEYLCVTVDFFCSEAPLFIEKLFECFDPDIMAKVVA